MKIIYTSPVFLLLILSSCSKQPQPSSSFNFQWSDTITVLTIGTEDEFSAYNTSKNSYSVLWDFGDGRTSTDNDIRLSYPEAGTYILKLIAKSDAGESISTKKVVVKNRVIKYILVDYVQWDKSNLTEPWPRKDIVDIYFQMQLFTDNAMNSDGFYQNSPIIYTSPVIENVNNGHHPPLFPSIFIPMTEKIIVQKSLVKFAPGNLNNAYLFSIKARDSDGNNYRLIDNSFSGSSFGIMTSDIRESSYYISQGGITSYRIFCDFE
jgi:PKD repeat protein